MFTILVSNIKGGCGKTTLATHLAAALAQGGMATVLADADRQRSSLSWAERRPAAAVPLTALDWSHEFTRPAKSTRRLVIDAPAALKTRQIEELVHQSDLVVVPILPGAFDEGATRRFLDKLDELKPIARNKKGVALIGNRLRSRTRAAERLDEFLAGLGHRVVTRLRDSQLYQEAAASGLSLFDLKGRRVAEVRQDWQPLLDFMSAQFPRPEGRNADA